MIRKRFSVFAGLSLALGIIPPACAEEALARLATGTVTREDVDRAIASQGAAPNAQNRQAALRAIVAAYAVEEQLAGGGKTLPPELDKAVGEARRRVMLDYYLGKQLKRTKPDDSAIDEFVRKNPQFFGARATYRYVRLLIDGGGKPLPGAVQAAIAQVQAGARPTIEGVNRLKSALRQLKLPVAAQQFYQGSEQIEPKQLRDLDAMARGDRPVRLRQIGRTSEVIILLDRFADPVDPADTRGQIASGLATQNLQAQSQQLIDDIGAAKLEELRQQRPEDTDVLSLDGKVDPSLKARREAVEAGGSVLNLFGRQKDDEAGEDGALIAPVSARVTAGRRAVLFLSLIGFLAPLVVATAIITTRSAFGEARRLAAGVAAFAISAVLVLGGFAMRARPLIEATGGRLFLAVLAGAGLAGTLAGLALWRVRQQRSHFNAESGSMLPLAALSAATFALALWLV